MATWKQHVMVLTAKTCLKANAVNTPPNECYKNVKKKNHESRHFFLKCIKTALKVVPYYNEPIRPTPASSLYPCNIYRWPLPSLIILFPFIFYHLRGWLTGPQLLFVCHDIWHHRMTECYVSLYLRHASLPWWDPTNIFIAPSPLSFFSVA